MTTTLKPNTGLALNQNILLEYYYKFGISPLAGKRGSGHYDVYSTYLELTHKQYIRARSSLLRRGFIAERSFYDKYVTEKGIQAIEQNDYIRSGPMGPHTGVRKPQSGTLSSYIWAALRTKSAATVEELLTLVSLDVTDDYEKIFKSTRRLLYWLCKAHIVRRLPRKKQGHHYNSRGHTRYQLMINLGPRHPIIRQRKHQLYDPNSSTNVPFKDILRAFKSYYKPD